MGGSIDTLERVIMNRPDPIRIHCLGVLGNLRDQAHNSVGTISQIFQDTDNSVEIREEAMIAIGKILDVVSEPTSGPVLKVITEGMANADLRLRSASYFAYSAAKGPKSENLKRLYNLTPPEVSGEAVEDNEEDAEGSEEESEIE